MRALIGLVLVSLAVTVTSGASADLTSLATASTMFGRDMYNRLSVHYDNVVFSPYSVHSALAMTSAGAMGDTLTEMKKTLKLEGMMDDKVFAAYKDLIASFNNTNDMVDLLTANAIFQNPMFNISDEFKDVVEMNFEATAQELNYSQPGGAEGQINDYVEEKTNDKIKDLFSPNSLDESTTKLVLVNTIFFNASWADPFDESDTNKTADFRVSDTETKKVHMMTQEGFYEMKMENDYKTLRLPFAGNRFALYIVVPNNTNALINPACLHAQYPNVYFTNLQRTEMKIFVPKFEINFKKSLPEELKKMGMMKAFTRNAEFSKISPNSMISEVIHQAVIEVMESGTTAAAATAVSIVLTSIQLPKNLPEFRVDQPFLFFLRDDTNALVLFQGKFAGPMQDPKQFSPMVQRVSPRCDGGTGDPDGAATLSLALIGWFVCIASSIFHLRRVFSH